MSPRRITFFIALFGATVGAFAQTAPITINTASPLPTGYEGIPYQVTFTATTTPANQSVSWSIQEGGSPPPGLSMAANGSFSGTPATGSSGSYTFTVQAALNVNAAFVGTTKTFTITITQPQVTILTASPLPNGLVGQFYTQTLQATSTPNLGITWSGANLPAGLTLSTAGLLSGTPSAGCAPCTFRIIAQITGTSVSTAASFSVTINAGQVVITTASLPTAQVNQPYSTQLTSTPTGATWAVNALTPVPPGMKLSTAGVLSGTATTAGAYTLTISASVQGYQPGQATLTIFVTTGPLQIVQTSIPVAIQNAAYTTTLTASGGLPPYQWATTNTLGFSIGATTGIVTGTPTVLGAQSLPVTLTDSTGTAFSEAFALFVAAPLSVLTTSLPNGTIGSSYSQTLQAGGGQAPYTWSLTLGSGALPTGLTLSAGGSISGTPTSNGAYSFTVQVTDFGQRTATKALSVTIGGAGLTITTASLPNGPIGVAYSQVLAASGGTTPYTWSIALGSLPAGLSLDPKSGTISGTPSGTPATSNFTVQVTDSTAGTAPLTAQKAFSVSITAAALTITTTSLPLGSVGAAYSQTLQASGGTPPYKWSLASGSLPAGLQLNATSGAITGTPTGAGPFAFVAVVTDSAGQTARQSLAITIANALTITTGNLTGTVGSAFSQSLSASGGASPYTFALTSGTLPAGLTFTASSGLIAGTPTAAGTSAVTFTVIDSNKQTATATITINVNQATLPPVTFTVGSGSQPSVSLCLASAFPSAVTGTLTASFQPSSSVAVGTDQSIQLILAGSLTGTGPTVTFSVPVCGNTPPVSATVTMGTVAGTITITPKLSANGADVTPSTLTPQTISIAAAPPVIQSVNLSHGTGTITVTVIGYSSTREVSSGLFTFAPATGSTLSQSALTVQLGSAFTTWYQNSASNAFGSQFQLTVPFTVSASALDIVAVTVQLTNTKGTSTAVTSQ